MSNLTPFSSTTTWDPTRSIFADCVMRWVRFKKSGAPRFRLTSPAFRRARQRLPARRVAARAKVAYGMAACAVVVRPRVYGMAYAMVVRARADCARVAGARVLARRLSREELLAQALVRKRVLPPMMPSQWPACWLVRGASRLQRPVRKPVGEVAQIPRRVRKPVGEVAQIPRRVRKPVGEVAQFPRRVRKPVEEVAQTPRRVREMVGEVARTQSRVRELALALEAQNLRRRPVCGQAWGLSPAHKFVPAHRLLLNVT